MNPREKGARGGGVKVVEKVIVKHYRYEGVLRVL